jgi:hypothetical protein
MTSDWQSPDMADGGGKLSIVIVGGFLALLASNAWGPAICQAVGVCPKPNQTTTPQPAPTTAPVPNFTIPPIPPVAETNIFLSKTNGPAGSQFKVSGEGFQAGETIVIRMSTTEIGRTTASAAGKFSGVEVTVPDNLGVFAGTQFKVTASGSSSIRFANAPFTVSG